MSRTEEAAPPARGRPRDPEVDRAIIGATVDLLAERGFDGVTMEAVACRAGVARATLYRRYANRVDLLEGAIRAVTPPKPDAPDTGSVRTDLIQVVHSVAEMVGRSDTGRMFPALLSASGSHPEAREALSRFSASRRGPSAEVIRRGVERGELRDDTDPELLAELLVGAVIYRLLVRGDSVSRRRVEHLVDTVLRGANA